VESYGMTEASHQMASTSLDLSQRLEGSVGRAAGPEIAIMDATGQILPPDSVGEVVIRGANVTAGYENNPAANLASFTNGWFRTGDQGWLNSDGFLTLNGRLKEMINRGGEKVAPPEIDAAALEHPAVAQAVCFALPHEILGEEVALVVVLQPEQTTTAAEIKEFLRQRLADFKIPREVIFVEEIPKGATGKVQRLGLAQALGLVKDQP
ncbi:MAG: AMP-binding protein, partial [Candidatus Pacebacteria bacterium]|nr:AMP-binding protein [Candidatus Paceibacterota bacterium]